jgi:hypothetical protein
LDFRYAQLEAYQLQTKLAKEAGILWDDEEDEEDEEEGGKEK